MKKMSRVLGINIHQVRRPMREIDPCVSTRERRGDSLVYRQHLSIYRREIARQKQRLPTTAGDESDVFFASVFFLQLYDPHRPAVRWISSVWCVPDSEPHIPAGFSRRAKPVA